MTDVAADAIAIVGLGCRFPGAGEGLQAFWNTLNLKTDVFVDAWESRWSRSAGEDKDAAANKIYCRSAGLIEGHDLFDAGFFGITAVEAEAMDPQQRLLLETSWHALEDAGIDPVSLRRSRTSVIMGATTDDYARLHGQSGLPVSAYSGLGVAKSMAASRLAYFYDLRGLVLQIDTSCSSALVAAHMAARELRDGTCDLALVGAANVLASPDTTIGFCEMRALSRTGMLRAFDDGADGYVRGEGSAVLVLKRYADAVRDGDRVRAILRGSAVNHDGRTNGLTAPNPAAQTAVLRSALENAGVTAEDIHYVETHGTGTPLGDLIEARALGSVYAPRSSPLRIGSAKANIGHLEAAAGAVGLAKIILSFEHGFVPGQVNFETPNHRVDWQGLRLDVSREDWRYPEGRKRAAVSSFGMSGTNVHMILEEPPRPAPAEAPRQALPITPFVAVSARCAQSLDAMAARYTARLAQAQSPQEAIAVACASQIGRAHHGLHRYALPLDAAGDPGARPIPPQETGAEREDLVFVFTGQGTQHPGMASAFFADAPAFRTSLTDLAGVFAQETGEDLVALTCDPERAADLERTELLQPALVAMNIALADFWQSLGIVPGATVGHSLGEFAAAVAAGSLEPVEAVRLACARGRAVARLAPPGILLAALGSAEAIAGLQRVLPQGVTVAAYNSPQQLLLACAPELEMAARAAARDQRCRLSRLASGYAFHSPDMRAPMHAVADRFERAVLRPSAIDWIGTAGREGLEQPCRAGGGYLLRQMTQPVGFETAVSQLIALGYRRFLEVGPDAVLQTAVRTIAGAEPVATAGTMRRGSDSWQEVSRSLRQLYEMGIDADWQAMWRAPPRKVELPSYAFSRRRYWLAQSRSTPRSASAAPRQGFDFSPLRQVGHTRWLELRVDGERQPHLLEHVIWGTTIMAAASWIAAWLQLARDVLGPGAVTIDRLQLHRPLVVPAGGAVSLSIRLDEEPGGRYRFLADTDPAFAAPLCSGSFGPAAGRLPPVAAAPSGDAGGEDTDAAAFYRAFEAQGYELGRAFRWMGDGRDAADTAFRAIRRPDLPSDGAAYPLFPGLIDSCFHALGGLLGRDVRLGSEELVIPAEIGGITLYEAARARVPSAVSVSRLAADGMPLPALSGRLTLTGEDEEPLLQIDSVCFRRISRSAVAQAAGGRAAPLPLSLQQPAWLSRQNARPGDAAELLVLTDDMSGDDARRALDDAVVRGVRDIVVAAQAGAEDGVEALAARSIEWRDVIVAAAALPAPLRVTVTGAATSAWSGMLTGLWLTAAEEHRNLSVRTVETGADASLETMIARLAAGELATAAGGHFRLGAQGWEERVLAPRADDAAPVDLTGRSALVTGGTGGLGPHFARWLLSLGAAKVYLLGRPSAAAAPDAADEPRIELVRMDLADAGSVERLFGDIAASPAPLGAIVHAAGALADQPLAGLTPAHFAASLTPKLTAARLLERFWPEGLKFVLALSSVAAVNGAPGQGAYVAANRAMENWARAARGRGQPVCTLVLGPVDAGMGARLTPAQKRKIRDAGADLMLADLLGRGAAAAVAAAGEPLICFTPAAARHEPAAAAGQAPGGSAVAGDIAAALGAELNRMMDGTIALKTDTRLIDLGVDSLLAAELSSWAHQRFGVELSPTTLLELPHLGAAADLIERLQAQRETSAPAEPAWVEGVI